MASEWKNRRFVQQALQARAQAARQAHPQSPPYYKNGEETESWGNAFVRPTDPDTSHDSAAELDEKSSSAECFNYFVPLYRQSADGVTRAELTLYIKTRLIEGGSSQERAHRKAESLRRRLKELRDKYGLICHHYDERGKKKKRARQEICYLTDKACDMMRHDQTT